MGGLDFTIRDMSGEELSKVLYESILPRVHKPARYIGGEVNCVVKDDTQFRFAISFPDVYEVGMSSTGLSIIYHVLNGLRGVQAERAFSPWHDMEKLMRTYKLPLYGLETFTPLKRFDAIGFSLSYELLGTNMLQMLDLSGIPLLSRERLNEDPIVIAGGCVAVNPEPFADFVDAFCVGDGEELVVELVEELMRTRGMPRIKRLERLAQIDGIYVPMLYELEELDDGMLIIKDAGKGVRIRRRVVERLGEAPFPTKPVVPWVEAVHDRANIEVFRGCTRGCRFCQAGMVNRPVRERDVQSLVEMAYSAARGSGYDEIGLLSLNTYDYSHIGELLRELLSWRKGMRLFLSLPSSRVDSFDIEIAKLVHGARRTGLTFAPEAATERLRRVINKPIGDSQIEHLLDCVFSSGWDVVKLYFMIGLPTETDEDVVAIAEMCNRIARRARSLNRRAKLHVSVAVFVPKPHTPFQWERQIGINESLRKKRMLFKMLRERNLSLKVHDLRMSFLEGVFSRGDRRLCSVLLEAYSRGCRFDGWADELKWDRWMQSFESKGIDPSLYLRERSFDESLPWDHIDVHLDKSFLWRERQMALNGEVTDDCRWSKCMNCGVNAFTPKACNEAMSLRRKASLSRTGMVTVAADSVMHKTIEPVQRIRFRWTKIGKLRFLSHMEMVRALQMGMLRAGLKISYSRGFNPRPKFSFGTALPVGVESEAEYADVWLDEWVSPNDFVNACNKHFPDGCQVLEAVSIPMNAPAFAPFISRSVYEVSMPVRLTSLSSREIEVTLNDANVLRAVCCVDVMPSFPIAVVQEIDDTLIMHIELPDGQQIHCRIADFLKGALKLSDDQFLRLRVVKRATLCNIKGMLLSPVSLSHVYADAQQD